MNINSIMFLFIPCSLALYQASSEFILTYMMCSFLDGKYFTISALILIKYSYFLYVMSMESKTVCRVLRVTFRAPSWFMEDTKINAE